MKFNDGVEAGMRQAFSSIVLGINYILAPIRQRSTVMTSKARSTSVCTDAAVLGALGEWYTRMDTCTRVGSEVLASTSNPETRLRSVQDLLSKSRQILIT